MVSLIWTQNPQIEDQFRYTWPYDRDAIHDGRQNTYSFVFNKVKFVLLPNKKVEPQHPLGEGRILLAKREFINESQESRVVLVLLGKESSKASCEQIEVP